MHLSSLLILPLLTALPLLLAKPAYAKKVALAGSLLQFLACAYLLWKYQQARVAGDKTGMLFQSDYVWFERLQIHFHTGVDGISIAMLLLTSVVVLAGILVSWSVEKMAKEFFFLIVLLSLGAYGFFISLNLFTMFFFLEIAVMPKFLLILIWGSGRKEYSAMKLALMLMAGSALVFVGLMGIYYGTGSFDMLSVSTSGLSASSQSYIFLFLFLGFGIFAALFPFHTWVPDGHASAPTAASMFLAGISMKLGGYGCLRVAVFLLPGAAHEYAWIIILLATIAIIYGAFATMMQADLKYINAYSSVSHCGFVLLGIGMLTRTSINGAVMQMVSHGLMTALFFAAIGMIYARSHTRMVAEMGGLLKVMPFISTIFVIAGLCSLGLPGLSGFVAEITVFMGSWQNPDAWYRAATILACASIVITAVYILRATGKVIMGPLQENQALLTDAAWNEKAAALILVIGILLVGMVPFLLTDLINPGTETIIHRIGNPLTVK